MEDAVSKILVGDVCVNASRMFWWGASADHKGDAAALAIASALNKSTATCIIDLSENDITVDGAKALASAFQSLKVIDLSRNKIGDDGAKVLAVAIAKSTTLVEINLFGNTITDVGAVALADAIGTSKSLRRIYLGGNHLIGDEGAKALALGIQKSATITDFGLSESRITGVGAAALANAVANSATLRKIWLTGNRIGSKGHHALIAAVERSTSIDLIHYYTPRDFNDSFQRDVAKAKTRRDARRAVWVLNGVGDGDGTPIARFVRVDGDHAVWTRVLKFLL